MIADVWEAVLAIATASAALTAGLLIVRLPLRRAFGAGIAYLAWLVVPFALFAALLPAPVAPPLPMATIEAGAMTAGPLLVPSVDALDTRTILLSLWLTGVLVTLVFFIVQQLRYSRHLARFRSTAAKTHAVLRVESGGPAVVGFWKPRIVLPADFEARYSPQERALILAHEQVHLDRGDTRVNALVALVRALNWFNPLIHYAASRMRIDQELACDALVLARFPLARRRYAEAMLKSQLVDVNCPLPPLACSWTDGRALKERIAMLKQPMPSRALHRAGLFAVVVLAGFVSCLVWAAQTPRNAATDSENALPWIDARVRIGTRTDAPLVNVLTPSGTTYSMRGDGLGDEAWEAELTPRVLDDGTIELAMVIRAEGRPTATPGIVVQPGKTATIEMGAPAGKLPLRVSATLALADDSVESAGRDDLLHPAADAARALPARPIDASGTPLAGDVQLRVSVGIDGRPSEVLRMQVNAASLTSVEADALAEVARETVKTWTFAPATRDGKPVESEVIVPLVFGRRAGDLASDRQFGNSPILDKIVLADP